MFVAKENDKLARPISGDRLRHELRIRGKDEDWLREQLGRPDFCIRKQVSWKSRRPVWYVLRRTPLIADVTKAGPDQRWRWQREGVRKHLREIVPCYFSGKDGKPFELADFHFEILDWMFKGGKYVVNIPTDHMKSDLATFLFPLLSLMENPNEAHIICCATLPEAVRRVRRLTTELSTNQKLLQDYPHLARQTKNAYWSAQGFNVAGRTTSNNNPSVRAGSWTSDETRQSRGKLIMDDLEGSKVRNSPTEKERLWEFMTLEAWRCWEDSGETDRPLLMSLGTPFDPESIYFDLESIGWQTMRFGAYLREERTTGPGVADVLIYKWPRKADKVEQAYREMPKDVFAIQYRLDPTGGDSSRFSNAQITEMLRRGTFGGEQVWTFVCLDPAGGSRQRQADYAGIAVVRLSWKRDQTGKPENLPTLEVPECFAFEQGLYEQVRLCAALARDYNCPVIVETNSQQGYTYPDTFEHLANIGEIQRVNLLRHYTTGAVKWDLDAGLSVMPTLLKSGRFRIPESQLSSDGVRALASEIRLLGRTGSHDHLLAAIWFAYKRVFDEVKSWQRPQIRNGYVPGGMTGLSGRRGMTSRKLNLLRR